MTRALIRSILVTLAVSLSFTSVQAGDHPVETDRLRLKDDSDPTRRVARFRASNDAAIDLDTVPDPRLVGATLQIVGTALGDGDTGTLNLPSGLWTGIGNPSGSQGYRYSDPNLAGGVRRVEIRRLASGGRLTISARGANWPFQILQEQEQVEVRLTVDTEIYCAEISGFEFKINRPGLVVARRFMPPPSDCALPVCGNGALESPEECDDGDLDPGDGCNEVCDIEPFCGNGVAEDPEECDDGDLDSGDGCSATCQLESPAAACAGVPTVSGTDLDVVLVAQGLDNPVFLTTPPLDPHRLFVVEQAGVIRIIEFGTVLPTPFLDISSLIQCAPGCGERGLLSMAFHPDYHTNGRFFVSYTDTQGDSVLARYQVSGDPNVADAGSGQMVLFQTQPASNHNGGQIAFSSDGHLWMGFGDGGGQGDPGEHGQSDTTLLGKLLRLDVEVEMPPYYAVPANNPNPGAGDPLGLIWAKGFRNPWRFSFDRGTGDLYIGDVGQDSREEIDYQPASSTGGENYGWNAKEGTNCYDPPPHFPSCAAATAATVAPVYQYNHDSGCSVTGGYVYRGCRMPDLAGTYFFSDFCANRVDSIEVVGGNATNYTNRTGDLDPPGPLTINSVSSFGEDSRGEIYIVDRTGEIFKIVPEP